MKKFISPLLNLLVFLLLSLLFTSPTYAATITWDGGGDGTSWSDGTNWSSDSTPTDADDVTIDVDATTVNLAASTTVNSLTLGNSGGTTTVTLNFTYDAIASGALTIDDSDLIIYSGGSITHSFNGTTEQYKINLAVSTGDLNLYSGGSIDAHEKGYDSKYGPGTSIIYSSSSGAGGAGYGGEGGSGVSSGSGPTYGSLTAPTDIGSGGGHRSCCTGYGGYGGGAVKVTVGGELIINGSINVNGGNFRDGAYDPGGGSGGSIYLTATTISGTTGSITSNGGNGDTGAGGGGGGGRIALYYTSSSYAGSLTAYGGTSYANGGYSYPTLYTYGGAGTIYEKPSGDTYGDLLIDNNDQFEYDDRYMGKTPLGTDTFDTITVQNKGWLDNTASTNVTYNTLTLSTNAVIEDNGGTFAYFSGGGSMTVPSSVYVYANSTRSLSDITVNGTITNSKNRTTETYKVNLTTSGNFTINSGGAIDVHKMGFTSRYGDGTITSYTSSSGGGGAGHGGAGGSGVSSNGGSTYGSLGTPTSIGSGGGDRSCCYSGGDGGGAIILDVGGTLTVNGDINADGGQTWNANYDPGGGSGGSIYILTHDLSGTTGAITTNGGDGWPTKGGGGGGGRIAIYYSGSSTYSGTLTSSGGASDYDAGEQGTVLLKATSGVVMSSYYDTGDPNTLIYSLSWSETLGTGTDAKFQLRTAPDNGGIPGTWTDWLGPSGAGTYYTDPAGGESINSTHADASNDQWVQYRILFSANSGDEYIPVISDVTLTYVVNTAPTVTITNTPTESSAGTFTTTYTVSDPEESSVTSYLASDIGITIGSDLTQSDTSDLTVSDASNLPSSGTLLIDEEMLSYTGKSGNVLSGITRGVNTTTDVTHLSGSSVWFIASNGALSGDYGSINTTGTKSITWAAATDISDLETTSAKLKVVVNDGNLANQVGSDSVTSITLDTKAPTGGDIYVNKYTGQITLSATDGNSILYKASNNNDLSDDSVNPNSGSWVAYSTPVDWTYASDPSTVYVAYKDEYGNTTSTYSTESPTRLSSLIIQDASNPETEEWRLFISWVVATTPSNGFAYYQIYRSTDGTNYSAYTQINTAAENYYVDADLDNTITYYYKTTIVDNHGNESDTNYPIQTSGSSSRSGIGLTPDGSGGGDFTAPVISNVSTSSLSTTSVTITWDTDELSDSTIGFSEDTGYASEVGSITMDTSHSLTLSNLTPDTKYYFRAMSADALNNKATEEDSETYYFTTLADTTGPTISDIKSVVGETSAGVTWATSEAADSLVEYSIDTSYSSSTSSASLVQGHALTLSGLTNETTYNYRVTSEDIYGNSTTSPSYTFTTSSVTVGDTTAPTISNISVSDITATSAKVSWETDEAADGKAEYGESEDYERGIAEGNHDYETSKAVTLIGLSPETTYHYRVQVVDAAGNSNASGDATFTTGVQATITALEETGAGISSGTNAPSITSAAPAVSEISGTSVTISWETDKKATSEIYYQVKNSLDAPTSTGSTNYVLAHSVTLGNLTPATTYSYLVKSTDVNGNYVTSATYEFTTTLPGVASVRVTSKTENSAVVEWVTAAPTSTIIEYTNADTRETKRYTNASLVTSHLVNLVDLIPSSAYLFEVLISDEAGNLARSDQYSFVTNQDIEGPTISGVNNRSTIVAGQNKVQTVVTWVTNEPTTSQVEYSLGSGVGDYEQSTDINTDFVTNHIMVIANLKPGSVYRYRVLSKDRADNEAASDPFVLLTPIREVSALDLIIQNLQGAFGWLGNFNN
jgi:hypothetical protein